MRLTPAQSVGMLHSLTAPDNFAKLTPFESDLIANLCSLGTGNVEEWSEKQSKALVSIYYKRILLERLPAAVLAQVSAKRDEIRKQNRPANAYEAMQAVRAPEPVEVEGSDDDAVPQTDLF